MQIGEKFGVQILQCIRCGTVIADCPEPEVVFYEQSYFGGSEYGYIDGAKATTSELTQDAAARRRLNGVATADKIVEVGSGNGSFVRAALNRGLDIIGVERSQQMRKTAYEVFGVTLQEEIPLMPDCPLALVLIEVLEHVREPTAFLEGIFTSLGKRPEHILLTTPNGDAIGLLGTGWEQVKPPEHLLLFTTEALRLVLVQFGYTNITFCYYQSIFLEVSIKRFGSRSNRKVPFLWGLSSLLRYADSALCRILPKRFALGLECYCAR